MNETHVTVLGYAGTNPVLSKSGKPYATFRLGSIRRTRRDGDWLDSPTAWYTVKAWGALAENVAESIRKSDPVLVAGVIVPEVWNDRIDLTLHATAVGPNLATGTARFAKVDRRQAADEAAAGALSGASGAGGAVAADPAGPALAERDPAEPEDDPFTAQEPAEPPF